MSYLTDAYTQCRSILGGDAQLLPDSLMATYSTLAEATLCQRYPCISGNGTTNNLSGNDLLFFTSALAYQMATDIASDPISQNVISSLISLKIGPMEKKYGKRDATSFVDALSARSRRCMLSVACVRSRAKGYNNQDVFALSGPRREIGDAVTLQDLATGEGQRQVLDVVSDPQAMVQTADLGPDLVQ